MLSAEADPNQITVFLYLFFKENNDKRTVEEANRRDVFTSLCAKMPLTARELDTLLEIMHCARNLQISE